MFVEEAVTNFYGAFIGVFDAENQVEELRTAGTDQPVNSQDFAFFQRQADVLHLVITGQLPDFHNGFICRLVKFGELIFDFTADNQLNQLLSGDIRQRAVGDKGTVTENGEGIGYLKNLGQAV